MKLGAKAKALHAKIADKGGNVMARFAGTVAREQARGAEYDSKRTAITRRRESRANDKAMGY